MNETSSKYVVYELRKNWDGNTNLMKAKLIEVQFDGNQFNSFDSEQEALDVMIEHKKFHMDFVILKRHRIYNF